MNEMALRKLSDRDAVLVKLDLARTALVEARTIQETKKIADLAKAMKVYSAQQKLGKEVEEHAYAIFCQAMRRVGKMLRETDRAKGAAGIGPVAIPERYRNEQTPTLAEIGLTPKESALAQKIARLPEEEFSLVRDGVATITKVLRELKKRELAANPLPPFRGRYRVIYADPPWKYNDQLAISNDGANESYGPADAHYPQMSIDELCALDVKAIAEDDAVLFIWVTSPLLESSFSVIEAWGFKYKASFVWDKVKHNMGHYNSVRHEFLLVATRGTCLPDESKLFNSVQRIERTKKHSEKPEGFRQIIDTLYTRGERIELFARASHAGWSVWGNEAPK